MKKYAIPVSIVVAGLLIAGAVFLNGSGKLGNKDTAGTGSDSTASQGASAVMPVTSKDHIQGNPDADIVIVEYSDLDCPYCKEFHKTLEKIMDEYGKTGQVAWVYRHLPLTQLHPNAFLHAEASECVASLGGNDAFWGFLTNMFADNPGNEQASPNDYIKYAEEFGISDTDLQNCMASKKFDSVITKDANNGMAAGAQGTPYSVIIVKGSDKPVAVSGAVPYENFKSFIDQILQQQKESI